MHTTLDISHIIRMDDTLVPSLAGYFGGRRAVRKPRSKIDDAVWRDAIDLLQPRKGKAQQGREEVGSRRSGKPWNENGPNRHRKRRRKRRKNMTKIQFVPHREHCVLQLEEIIVEFSVRK